MSINPRFEIGEPVKLLIPNGQNIKGVIIDRASTWQHIHVYKVRDERSTEKTGYLDYHATEAYLSKREESRHKSEILA